MLPHHTDHRQTPAIRINCLFWKEFYPVSTYVNRLLHIWVGCFKTKLERMFSPKNEKSLAGNKRINHMSDLGIDGNIILKYLFILDDGQL
jgi:hypothetical protein